MATYEYMGMRKTSKREPNYEAQDELLINGRSISAQVEGYRQLTVSGRGLVPYEVDTVDYLSRSGAKPTSYRTGVRDFTVKYRLIAKSSEDLRGKFDKLHGILANGALTVGFKDDEEYVYEQVYLTGADVSEEDTNTIISTFTLTAYDPYRYSKTQTEGDVVKISSEFVEVDEIRVEFAETVDRPTINIRNGIYNTDFRLVGTVTSGTIFRLRIDRNTGRISTTGGKVEMASLPRELVVYNGANGRVSGSASSKVTFKWRDKKL